MHSVKHSLTKRQAIRIFFVSIGIFVLLIVVELPIAVQHKRHSLSSLQNQIINLASEGATHALWAMDTIQGRMHLDAMLNIHGVQQVEILEPEKKVFVSRENRKHIASPLENRIGQWLFGGLLVAERPLFITLEQIGGDSRTNNIGFFRVTLDPTPLTIQFIGDVQRKISGSALRVLLLAIVLSIVLHRFLTKPLASLGTQISINDPQSSEGSMLQVPAGHAEDEIGMIVQQFNHKHRTMEEAIQKLQQSENFMRESELRFRTLFEGAQDGILVVDIETKQCIDANPAMCAMTNYTLAELQKMSVPDIYFVDDLDDLNKKFQQMASGTSVVTLDRRVLCKDGSIVYTDINASCLIINDRPCAVGFFRDTTERKKREDQLQQAQKMESIGTLAGGIAHDFNNILGAILGYAELAMTRAPKDSPLLPDLTQILTAGNRAKKLVTQILTFSRQTETDRINLQPQPILKEAVKFLRSSIPTTITIEQNIDANCGMIKADPTQFHQVIMNLCTNAYQAMEEHGGTLSIALERKELTLDDLQSEPSLSPGSYLQLTIRDTGPGIDPTVRDHVFDPYFTTKETGKGTGMGLAVVHGIVKTNGGMIRLESSKDQGTAFHIFYPVVPAKEAAGLSEDKASIPTGGEKILFVDDEPTLVDLGKRLLEILGYSVTGINDSSEALKVFRARPDQFDLVITDQTMHGLTGSELAQQLFIIRPDIPVILCTGYSSILSRKEALAMGIRGYITKPMIIKEIAPLVRRVLDGENPEQERSERVLSSHST